MKTLPKKLLLLLLISCAFLPLSAQKEVINNFEAQLTIQPDGSLLVNETINVTTAGRLVKRGITRAITRRPIGGGHQGQFDYEVLGVKRDGQTIAHFDKRTGSLHTFYLGSKSKKLPSGTYTYDFRYQSDEQLYRADSLAELRWHLVDTESSLPTELAQATIFFPEGMDISAAACYAGKAGTRDQYCTTTINGNEATFTLSRALQPGEGMTIAAGVPVSSFPYLADASVTPALTGANGLISTPTTSGGRINTVSIPSPGRQKDPSNKNGLYVILFGFLGALVYAVTTWREHGRDPEVNVNEYVFYPPEGMSPAEVSRVYSAFYGQYALTASLTALTVRGAIHVEEDTTEGFLGMGKQDYFVLRQTEERPTAATAGSEQLSLYERLFRTQHTVELDGEYNKQLAKAAMAHANALDSKTKAFREDGGGKGRLIWQFVGILLATLVAGVYFGRGGHDINMIAFTIGLVATIPAIIAYSHYIRRPSVDKVRTIKEVKALRRYLKLSAKERDAVYNAPEMTQDYYDHILPYAIGLNVKNDWAADLAHDWAATSARPDYDRRRGAAYTIFYAPNFGQRLGDSFATTSTDPSSSSSGGGSSGSYSGGGGSVGGGGGGTGGF